MFTRVSSIFLTGVVAASILSARPAHAEQPRDWMVAAQPGGTRLSLDILLPGIQAIVEHRIPVYGLANEVTFRANALPTIVFLESQADVDVRFLVLTLGASFGVREVFHAYEFRRGQSFDRQTRRDLEFAGGYTDSFSTYGEGRVQLSLPFNDHVVLLNVNGLRFEGGHDRAFDWRLGIVRDGGAVFRSDTTLFIKHRDLGAFGPRVMFLNYELDGAPNNLLTFGFTVVTRPGFRKRNDLLFVSMLFGVGGTINSQPTDKVFGNHLLGIPATLELAYRTVFDLSGPVELGAGDED